ncbi:hypothetical protein DL98DRAFT_616694 [Cadophora sp. DSE1049]|nr:hypothetical protein DL98DRAFT_616694 [Cadophora sp. DSE1049]
MYSRGASGEKYGCYLEVNCGVWRLSEISRRYEGKSQDVQFFNTDSHLVINLPSSPRASSIRSRPSSSLSIHPRSWPSDPTCIRVNCGDPSPKSQEPSTISAIDRHPTSTSTPPNGPIITYLHTSDESIYGTGTESRINNDDVDGRRKVEIPRHPALAKDPSVGMTRNFLLLLELYSGSEFGIQIFEGAMENLRM